MPHSKTIAVAVLLATGLAGAWIAAPSFAPGRQPSRQSGPRAPAIHPVAALAWVQAHCDSSVALDPDTPRIQAEDLIVMTAALDERAAVEGQDRVCRDAVAQAAPISRQGERATAPTSVGARLAQRFFH